MLGDMKHCPSLDPHGAHFWREDDSPVRIQPGYGTFYCVGARTEVPDPVADPQLEMFPR